MWTEYKLQQKYGVVNIIRYKQQNPDQNNDNFRLKC